MIDPAGTFCEIKYDSFRGLADREKNAVRTFLETTELFVEVVLFSFFFDDDFDFCFKNHGCLTDRGLVDSLLPLLFWRVGDVELVAAVLPST